MSTNHFTFVTALYRIGDNPIQADRIRSYIEHGSKLLKSGLNVIAFCEPEMASYIKSLNKSDSVIVIPIPKSVIPNYRFLDKIRHDRARRNYNPDPRNTPEYFAITCSKPWFVSKAISLNLFESTHFAWCDFGLYKTCNVSDRSLNRIIETKFDKINVAILNSHPADLLEDDEKYYEYGRPGMGGTFWSGNKENMSIYADLAMEKVERMIELGLGHADEQIMFQIYHDNPDLFRCYPADYISIVENAVKIENVFNVNECLKRIQDSKRYSLLDSCLRICRESGLLC